jgi:hypothetical protein
MQFKICDIAFAHAPNIGWFWKSVYDITWYRGQDYYQTCFFTDSCLPLAETTPAKRKIAIILEPPELCPNNWTYVVNNQHLFDYVLTYGEQLIRSNPQKFLYYPIAAPWIPKADRKIYPKNKLVSIIASAKQWITGHKLRHEIIRRFGQDHGLSVFGGGAADVPKTPMLRDYMFSIAVMNSKFDDYFTEVVTDCFAVGTIPIFWGTKNISKYFNSDGILFFDTLDELHKILSSLSLELYLSKLEAIRENFELSNNYLVSEDYMYEHYPFLFN